MSKRQLSYKKETILITGANGMLGPKLALYLSKKGFNVLAAYHSKKSAISKIKNIKLARVDVASESSVRALGRKLSDISVIIHCAAIVDTNRCERNKEECFNVNVIGARNVTNLAKQLGAKMIYLSTPMVFSGRRGNYKEYSKADPVNEYARTKWLGEKEVLKYGESLVLRVNPLGVRPKGMHPSFLQFLIEQARGNASFELFKDVRINPVSARTIAGLISRFIRDFKPGILHIGSRDLAKVTDIWHSVVSRFPGFSGKVKEVSIGKSSAAKVAKRPKEVWINVDKAVKLGYKMPSWKREIKIALQEAGV